MALKRNLDIHIPGFETLENKHDASLDNFFLSKRDVFLWDDINQFSAKKCVQELLSLSYKTEPIVLYICTDGGEVEAACAIIDTINSLKKKMVIRTIGLGFCYSAGATILAMGTKGERCATKNTTIMMHPTTYDAPADYMKFQKNLTIFQQQSDDYFNKMVARACNKTYKEFSKKVENGLWMTASAAMKFGVIDKIV